ARDRLRILQVRLSFNNPAGGHCQRAGRERQHPLAMELPSRQRPVRDLYRGSAVRESRSRHPSAVLPEPIRNQIHLFFPALVSLGVSSETDHPTCTLNIEMEPPSTPSTGNVIG